MEAEKLSIVITTFDRGDGSRTNCLTNTVKSLHANLKANLDLLWVLADDGSPKQEEHLKESLDYLTFFGQHVVVTNAQRQGVGKSKNIALAKAFEFSDCVFLLEDDWIPLHPFDLSLYIDIIKENTDLGMFRFGFLGGGMLASYVGYKDLSFWDLQRGSGVYIYSGQVSLRHRRFYDVCGYHAEGLSPGEEELEFCKRYNGTENAPKILWPAFYGSTFGTPYALFTTIGVDFSLNSVQPGT